MEALSPEDFLKQIVGSSRSLLGKDDCRTQKLWRRKTATPEIILRRLQFGVVMERKAAKSVPRG